MSHRLELSIPSDKDFKAVKNLAIEKGWLQEHETPADVLKAWNKQVRDTRLLVKKMMAPKPEDISIRINNGIVLLVDQIRHLPQRGQIPKGYNIEEVRETMAAVFQNTLRPHVPPNITFVRRKNTIQFKRTANGPRGTLVPRQISAIIEMFGLADGVIKKPTTLQRAGHSIPSYISFNELRDAPNLNDLLFEKIDPQN